MGDELNGIKASLRTAITGCSDRCLYHASKWAAELLNSTSTDTSNDDDTDDEEFAAPSQSPSGGLLRERKLQRRERDKFSLAKTLFNCKEYDRCAVTLLPSLLPQQPIDREFTSPTPAATPRKGAARSAPASKSPRAPAVSTAELSHKSLFLAVYARYVAGEKRKEEDSEMILGASDGPITANKELVGLLAIMEEHFQRQETLDASQRFSDGYLEYLYGVLLLKGRSPDLAKHWLIRSVNVFSWNWSAWQELAEVIQSPKELTAVCQQIQPSVPAFLFQVYSSQQLYQFGDSLYDKIAQLSNMFPKSAFLQTQRALLHYHAKDFDSALNIFSTIVQANPYRLDNLDVYSNVLYVMENARPRLSYLATLSSAIDRFRPETCCIIGNHYSKASEHEKAVIYFRRALTLDRSFLSAWTLMGHEYIELKNTQAAIESYRRAVDANGKDYRAWHGLGLGYELLDLHSYALYYYQRAAALQPWDPKMWSAVGASYEKCSRPENAIRAYKRALSAASRIEGGGDIGSSFGSSAATVGGGDVDPLAACVGGRLDPDVLHQIALLYEGMRDDDEAAAYMELCLAQEEGPDEEDLPPGVTVGSAGVPAGIGVTQTTSRARLWLARYCMSRGEFDRCMELANELCQDGFEVEEAKGLIKDVRGRMGDQSILE